MKKIYTLLFFGCLLTACTKRDSPFYSGGGIGAPTSSVLNSNVRIVSLCTAPTSVVGSENANPSTPQPYIDHIFWDLVLGGKSMANYGIGGYSGILSVYGNYTNFLANPIPANPIPGLLPNGANGVAPANSGTVATPFTIPDSLLDGSGNAHVQVNYLYSWYSEGYRTKDSAVHMVDTTLTNAAQDLYLYNNNFTIVGNFGPTSTALSHKVFPRAVSVTDPSKFKIRIINLCTANTRVNINTAWTGSLPGSGKISLSYANAKPVNTAVTSNILPGAASDYVELPYGTYQFKVFDEQSILIPGNSGIHGGAGGGAYGSQPSGDNFPLNAQGLPYVPIRTYMPGGIYTIVVFDNLYSGGVNNNYVEEPNYIVVADNKPAANISYANIQWANAIPGATQTTLQIDGQPLQSPLDFGNSSAYSIFSYGQHTLTLLDNSNKTLVTKSFFLPAMTNYTAWAYADAAGQPQMMLITNAMDFTNNGAQKGSDFNFACRFLNFCPDVANATFTSNNFVGNYGQTPDAIYLLNGGPTVPVKTYENLAFATPVQDTAYLMPPAPLSKSTDNGYLSNPFYALFRINAFASQAWPSPIVPGDPIPGLTPLDQPFIMAPSIYPNPLSQPNADAGVFTCALVGRVGADARDPSQNVRLMVIKHVQ